jgi:hypothetical protein
MNRLKRLEHAYGAARCALAELRQAGVDTRRLADHTHWLRRQYVRELRDAREAIEVCEAVTTAEQQEFYEKWIELGGEV